MSYRASLASKANTGKIEELHLVVNSRLTQLIEATRAAAHSEGIIEGNQTAAAAAAAAAGAANTVATVANTLATEVNTADRNAPRLMPGGLYPRD